MPGALGLPPSLDHLRRLPEGRAFEMDVDDAAGLGMALEHDAAKDRLTAWTRRVQWQAN